MLSRDIMCSKPNVVTTLRRLKIGNITLIKCSKGFVACLVLPYLVEKRHKPLVLLTIDGLQFYGEIACLLQRLARKKERSVVILAQHTFLMFCHYGSQLLQVAYHEQLNAAKGQIVLTITAHHRVDGIKQVAAHHTDLVDDQEIHRTNDVSLHLAELKPLLLTTGECSTRKIRRKGQLKGIEEFSHLWLIWGFSGNAGRWQMTVRPPRLGGNKSVGVFASRSPFRPNGLGLSAVVLDKVDWDAPDGPVLKVLGGDLMDGTPIYDIKPYIRYADSHPEALSGYTDNVEWEEAEVVFPSELEAKFRSLGRASSEDVSVLKKVLAQKPVPRYQHDSGKIYGMPYKACDIRFKVAGGRIEVVDVVGDLAP